jgi:hypothetical protein
MAIAGELAALRGRFAACRAMALTDLATGLVLCAATRERIGQEQLDALCATARSLLGGSVDAALTGIENAPVAQALLAEGAGVALFLRLSPPATEALCCACDAAVDLAALADAAAAFLGALDRMGPAGSLPAGETAA